jgi:outer membrane protein assembly factor BamB
MTTQTSTAQPSSTPPFKPAVARPWVPWALAAAAIVGIAVFRSNEDGGLARVGTFAVSGGFFLGCFIWYALASNRPARQRYAPLLTMLGILGAFAATFRVESVTGDMFPTLAFRWTPRPDQRLAAQSKLARESDSAVDMTATSANDYPGFLGSDGRAHVRGVSLATDWAAQPPKLLWRQPLGAGWSSFAIVNGFAVTQEQRGEAEYVTCYELRTGKVCWTYSRPVRFVSDFGGVGPLATPTIDRGRVFALGATGILSCLSGHDGALVWERDILADNGAANVKWGKSCSPLIVDDKVIVSAGGANGKSLVAYNVENGDMIWQGGDQVSSYASPVLAHFGGTLQIVMVNQQFVTSHDLATGRVLWERDWPGYSNSNATVSQPVPLDESRMLISKGYGQGAALWSIEKKGDTYAVDDIWHNSLLKTKFTNVVIEDGFIYGLDEGVLCCVELESGRKQWKQGRYGHGQIMLVGSLILVAAEDGVVALVPATPSGYQEVARFQAVEGKTWANPAISGNVLVVRSETEAAAYELPTDPGAT